MANMIDQLLSKISLQPNTTHETLSAPAEFSRLDLLIDRIIPRGGAAPELIHVALEEYLARVASLYRKLVGSRYRLERWREVLSEHESRFAEVEKRGTTDSSGDDVGSLLPNANASFTISLQDARLESEFEALLSSMRSTLDHLARLVASYSLGKVGVHRYAKLRNMFGSGDRISTLVSDALDGWAGQLISRRDEITHYVAPVLASTHRKVTGSQSSDSAVLAGVSRVSLRRSVPVWHCVLPAIGGSQQASASFSSDDGVTEKHAISDASGRLIIECVGPLPESPPVVASGELVENLYRAFESHLADILIELRDRWEH
ncbi:MAG: hypothetical protein AB1714_30955 [Acidobacteriota bacterium]